MDRAPTVHAVFHPTAGTERDRRDRLSLGGWAGALRRAGVAVGSEPRGLERDHGGFKRSQSTENKIGSNDRADRNRPEIVPQNLRVTPSLQRIIEFCQMVLVGIRDGIAKRETGGSEL